jgi:hypothetical protein
MGKQDDRRVPAFNSRTRGPDTCPHGDQLQSAHSLASFGAKGGQGEFIVVFYVFFTRVSITIFV